MHVAINAASLKVNVYSTFVYVLTVAHIVLLKWLEVR